MKIKLSVHDVLFFILFFLVSIKLYINGSTISEFFTIGNMFNYFILIISLLFIFLKFMFIDEINIYYLSMLLIFNLITFFSFLNNGNQNLIYLSVLSIFSYKVKVKYILEFFLKIKIPFILVVVLLSLFNIIENFQFQDISRGSRYAFGLIYATDFASVIFYINIAYIYIKYDNIKIKEYIFIFILSYIVYYYTDARLNFYLTVLAIVGFIFMKTRLNYLFFKLLKNKVGACIYIYMFLLSLILSYYYNPNNSIYKWLNKILTGRLHAANKSISDEGIYLFGNKIILQGNGWSLKEFDNTIGYNFIDSSYIQWLLIFGLVFSVLILYIFTKVNFYCLKKSDYLLLFILILISISGLVDHHILNISHNPFIFVVMSLFASSFDKEIKL